MFGAVNELFRKLRPWAESPRSLRQSEPHPTDRAYASKVVAELRSIKNELGEGGAAR